MLIGTAITKARWELLVAADATPTELLRADDARWRVQHHAFPYGILHLTDVFAVTGTPPQPTYGGGRHMRCQFNHTLWWKWTWATRGPLAPH